MRGDVFMNRDSEEITQAEPINTDLVKKLKPDVHTLLER